MKRFISFVATAILAIVALTPCVAKADTTYVFDFTSSAPNNAISYSGSGTFDVTGGIITGLTGTFYSGTTNEGAMTLLAPGTFASNDNAFNPWIDENGLSFSASGVDYNIYYYATSNGYSASGCAPGDTCITSDAYGNPSTPITMNVSETPEPGTLLLFGTGLLGMTGFLFQRKMTVAGFNQTAQPPAVLPFVLCFIGISMKCPSLEAHNVGLLFFIFYIKSLIFYI